MEEIYQMKNDVKKPLYNIIQMCKSVQTNGDDWSRKSIERLEYDSGCIARQLEEMFDNILLTEGNLSENNRKNGKTKEEEQKDIRRKTGCSYRRK